MEALHVHRATFHQCRCSLMVTVLFLPVDADLDLAFLPPSLQSPAIAAITRLLIAFNAISAHQLPQEHLMA